MKKKKGIWLTSFALICIGMFVFALQLSGISTNQKLKALESNSKNSLIELATDSENLEVGSEFNLNVFVSPNVTKAIELPLPAGLTFNPEQIESPDYQISYDSASSIITIQPTLIEAKLAESDSAIEPEVTDETEQLTIPIALQVEKAGEFLLEAKTVYQEDPLSSNQVSFDVAETSEKPVVETSAELEKPIAAASEADVVEPVLPKMSARAAGTDVGTWAEFIAAIADTSVSEINLTSDITRTATTAANNPGTLTRSLTIHGNNFTINFGSGGTTSNGILLGIAPVGTQLTLDNVQLVKTQTPTTPIFNAVTGATGLGTNWVINVSNTTTTDANTSGLVGAVNATVNLQGTNNLSLNASASHLNVRHVIFEENSIFKSESKATNSSSAIGITNGTVLVKENAKVTINNVGTSGNTAGNAAQSISSSSAIAGSISDFTMEPKSEVLTTANIYGYRTTIQNNFTMTGGAKFEAIGNTTSTVVLAQDFGDGVGVPATINISGAGTSFKVSTNSTQTANYGAAMRVQGDGSIFNISDGAEFNGHAKNGSALQIQSQGSQFNVKNKAKLILTQDNDNRYTLGATLRFRIRGIQTFNVTGDSEVNITKFAGPTPAVRMYGDDNVINVNTGGKVNVRNYGNGTRNDGGGDAGNQGLLYTNGNRAVFNLEDAGSSVDVRADFGPALRSTGSSEITAGEGTIFKMRGNTNGQTGGIFNTAVTTITVDRPLFFDFRNDRPAGGYVFNVNNGSTFKSIQSDLSVWARGDNLDGDPVKNWSLFDYQLSGANYVRIDSTNVPAEFNTGADSYGTTGASAYARMSGNNARAVVDELRVPTNADKSIFGHVTIPVGGEDGRDAWTDEAYVVVKLTKADGSSQELTGSTVGKNNNSPGLSVYGEESRAGMFKIPVPNNVFLETGDKLEVVKAWRGSADPNSNRVHVSLPEDLIAPNRTTFKITPPTPAVITNSRVVDNATKQIMGTSDEPGSEVEISVNGVALNATAIVAADGTFTFNLPHYLEKGDVVQVKLRDHAGSASAAGVDNPPSTNNEVGNINPTTDLPFHDTIFLAAPSVTVADILPDTNTAVKSVVVDNDKNVTQVGSILTYTINVANNKAAAISTNWAAVTIEDQLDEGLDPDLNSFTLNGTSIPASDIQFDEATRRLKVKVGNLTTQEDARLTFDARVNSAGIDRTILNKATAIGNSPREVEPFELGPENPTAEKQTYQAVSNEIPNPGGNVFGVLELVSAPTDISFGENLKVSAKNEIYPVADMSGGLTVQDSRAVKSSWTVTARMSAVLESPSGKTLPNAVYYTYKGTDNVLGTDSILVYQHTSTNEDPLTISDSWNTQEGLSLRTQVGKVYPENYQGQIEWALQDTPENE